MAGYRVTVEATWQEPRIRLLPVVTRADLKLVAAVLEDLLTRAKSSTTCRAVTVVLHLPDCDHEG